MSTLLASHAFQDLACRAECHRSTLKALFAVKWGSQQELGDRSYLKQRTEAKVTKVTQLLADLAPSLFEK